MTNLPALYRFWPGREVVLAKASGQAVATGATVSLTPHAPTWPNIAVAAGDLFDRGGLEELVLTAISDNAGTVHITNHPLAAPGTAILGTVASLALNGTDQAGTVVTLDAADHVRLGAKLINSSGTAAFTYELRGRLAD